MVDTGVIVVDSVIVCSKISSKVIMEVDGGDSVVVIVEIVVVGRRKNSLLLRVTFEIDDGCKIEPFDPLKIFIGSVAFVDDIFRNIGRRNLRRIEGGGDGDNGDFVVSISIDGGSSGIIGLSVTFDTFSIGFCCFRLRIKLLKSSSRFSFELIVVVISGLFVVVSWLLKHSNLIEKKKNDENFSQKKYKHFAKTLPEFSMIILNVMMIMINGKCFDNSKIIAPVFFPLIKRKKKNQNLVHLECCCCCCRGRFDDDENTIFFSRIKSVSKFFFSL